MYVCKCNKNGRYSIPYGVKKVQFGAFYECCELSYIFILYSVYEIGWFTFGYCLELSSIISPLNINDLNSGIFYKCTNLSFVIYLNLKVHQVLLPLLITVPN